MLNILLTSIRVVVIAAVPAIAVHAAAPEAHSAGDIPDSQVFVQFSSPLGYSIKVPEG